MAPQCIVLDEMLITLLGLVEFRLVAAEANDALGLPGTDGQHGQAFEGDDISGIRGDQSLQRSFLRLDVPPMPSEPGPECIRAPR